MAQEKRDNAHAAGRVPLLQHEYEVVVDMADALRAHPAVALFGGRGGKPEQSMFWRDGPTGIWRRSRLDWHPVLTGRRLVVPDYKTCASADPEKLSRAVDDWGYQQQADWYLDGIKALGLAGDVEPVFVFVFQEKTPPYVVTVAELTMLTLEIGRALNRKAIGVYQECTRTGRWPGYADDVHMLSLPPWSENRHMQELFS